MTVGDCDYGIRMLTEDVDVKLFPLSLHKFNTAVNGIMKLMMLMGNDSCCIH